MIDGLKPYSDYKESGVNWLGGVPHHWRPEPGFAAFREKQVSNVGMQEKTVLSLSYGRIVVKPPEKLHGLVPKSFETYQVVEPGDIIIRSTDLQNDWNSLRVGLVRDRGIITSAYLCLRITSVLSAEYCYHLLHAFDLMKVFYGMGSGLRQNLAFSDFKRLPLFVPPLDEQAGIVRFLEHANRKIDGFIRAKKKLIGLLNEQKQAIIHRAVTRGLNPDARLKPSGIAPLGDIPKHWETPMNSRIFRENIRPHNGQAEPPLSLSQRDGLIKTEHMRERSLKTSTYDNWKVTAPGDLVANRFKAHLGVFFASTLRGIVSFHYAVFEPQRRMNTKYFELLYHTAPYRTIYAGRSNGMTVGLQNLSNQNFYAVRAVVPPVEEQDAIVLECEVATQKQNTAIARTEREIALMQEYRTRLTADVVTGKLDVRAAAAKLPDMSAYSALEPAPNVSPDEADPDEAEG
jgi:type I restriction enzyme, S subunit